MSKIHFAGPVAYLEGSASAVFFSAVDPKAGTTSSGEGTALKIQKLQNDIEVAYWGEDNRFPQNIEQQMAYCGIGKYGLDWKMRKLFGNGIVPGKITGTNEDGSEIFIPLDRTEGKHVYKFIEDRRMFRFWIEYLQDWVWFFNCFPEVILSKDGTKITGLVHQESSDCRYKQMNEDGKIDTVYLSKIWGASADQYAKFDPTKTMRGLRQNPQNIQEVDNKFIKQLPCIDMYDPVASLKEIVEKKLKNKKGLKSAILPVNYPSVNKTYYQVPYWDGARLGGWVEIASKIPALLKTLYNKAFRIKYHIKVPTSYLEDKYGYEKWHGLTVEEQSVAKSLLLREMDEFLSGDENAFKSFVSFYNVDPNTRTEYGKVELTVIEDKTNIDQELITGSAADLQILIAMGVHPTLLGAGTIGTGQQRSGGSDIRESDLIYTASLNLERNVVLEPLYLVRDYNEWDKEIVFRIRDTILTTLDTGAGTAKKLS